MEKGTKTKSQYISLSWNEHELDLLCWYLAINRALLFGVGQLLAVPIGYILIMSS